MNAADTAWIMTATALVLFMTLPGLALFYGGLVRARNVLSVFMHCYAIACLMSVLWFLVGYSIAFGSGGSGLWGGLDKIGLSGVTADSLSGTLPEVLFFAFQMTFAIITPALIVGAYVERINFGFMLLFSGLWMLLCYAPVVHWVWGGGMLADGGLFGETGVKDFAGGIVVHETAGIAALVLAVMWERVKFGKSSLAGIVTGTIAGLASITPASGFVGPWEALLIGAVAGILCQEAVVLIRNKIKIDDTLDVFAVHGVGGIFGTIMIAAVGAGSWVAQLGSLAIVGVYTVIVSVAIAVVCKAILPMRVDEETETNGLDLTVHGERAYDMSS
jgi:Amt family ammonium transporter